ncbi:MAG: energy transducer TonB [Saprospiraceae bacterium]
MQKEKKDKHFIKKPIYPGGPQAMRQFIRENLRYPLEALAQKTEGTVTLKYAIDHLGHVTEAKVVAGLGHGCDEEAVRLVKLLRFEVPKHRGVKVRFTKDIHIHFKLPKAQPKAKVQTAQVQYTVTSASKPAGTEEKKENEGNGYSYTITIV